MGAAYIAFGIIGLIALKIAEWENIIIVIELIVIWLILVENKNFISLFIPTRSTAALASQWLDSIVIFKRKFR